MKYFNRSHAPHSQSLIPRARQHQSLWTLLGLLAATLLGGCGITVYPDNPLLQGVTDKTPTACVYFIRPALIKPKGFADKPMTVTFEGEKLLTIDQGFYTMLKMKPGKGDVITHSMTKFTTRPEPIKVARKREYNFIAGKTYFIYLKRIDDGFRGVFYDPAPASLAEAKKVISYYDVSARGAARDAPIDEIKEVPDAPPAGPLKPALPEDLYPHYHYLKKKPVVE